MSNTFIPADTETDGGSAAADWWRQATVYQVYPRSFADSDGDGLGDIRGVTSKVPYLSALGVDAIWLSPFYPSALADGGYDVADYRDVDPKLGTLAHFDELVEAAHSAGIKVVVDIVPNHTSDQHAWFQEALASEPGSTARARYIFRDGLGDDGSTPPSTWPSNFGGSAWTRLPDGQWYLHLFAPEQPDLDWSNPEVRDDFKTTLRFWADRGVDGFRVDVAHGLAKDLAEPFRDANPKDFGLPTDGSDPLYDRDEVHEIFEGWREVFNEYDPPRTAVAEAWVPRSRVSLYARPTELGQAFNFELLRSDFDATAFRAIIENNLALAAESGASSTWVLSNHDVVRHATRYGLPTGTDQDAWLLSDGTTPPLDAEQGARRARAATLLLLALPGSAYLYQGEELGLFEVADLQPTDLQDPVWTRSSHERKGRDGCRVPLAWDTSAPAFGFGTHTPHLPQPAWFADYAVSVEEGVEGSSLEFYRTALGLRHELQQGESLAFLPSDGETVSFDRHRGWRSVTNFGTGPVALPAGEVLVASGPLGSEGTLPGETTVWLRPSS
ncbi:alpha-amylase [Frondihabitans sp. PAMC 28766]|uniref:glycoside hydrolase family 13 protein n=1 Tax=Frondihabitans sp. PAMC 28766 TaxID=1795630 RepID=UPI00078E26E2|nr:glycoside hydrolase family 13 protein [Frondihabitans sp. PAMC 28766]AMM21665.1 alpha-amylase [Frondihabitans sp. PAMC 28766]